MCSLLKNNKNSVTLRASATRWDDGSVQSGYGLKAIKSPFNVILANAGLEQVGLRPSKGIGVDVVTGKEVNMIKSGIIDPVLVTKSALKNAVSVVNTIISADCVISNIRVNESN